MMPNTHTNRITIKIIKVTTTIIINITHSTIITTTTPIITTIATIIIMKIIIIQIDKIMWDTIWECKRNEEIRKIKLVRCWSRFKIRIRNNLLTIRFLSRIIVIIIEITTLTLTLFLIITLTIIIIIITIITIMIATILYKATRRIIMKNTTI